LGKNSKNFLIILEDIFIGEDTFKEYKEVKDLKT
jgi:hypothetical protein